MDFHAAVAYLYDRLPMFQRQGAAAIKKDLTNTLILLDAMGNPHLDLKYIHIAGTNGKGTSAHTLSAILHSAGYKTGLYTSPHLKFFTERIRINGREVDETYVAGFVTRYQSLIEEVNPSFFEVTVVMALEYFRQANVDLVVMETGLGGRLDSTNVITPEVCLITMIGWDHSDLLGDSLEKIAGEKAGIIKPKIPVVVGAHQPEIFPVFKAAADHVSAPLLESTHYQLGQQERMDDFQQIDLFCDGRLKYKDLVTDVTAAYYASNLPGILTVIDVLIQRGWKISEEDIRAGIADVKGKSGLKGRWQVLSRRPLMVADVSHNEPGLKALFAQVVSANPNVLHLVFGVVKDKDLARILPILPEKALLYFTQSNSPRSLPAGELLRAAELFGKGGKIFSDVNMAIKDARRYAGEEDMILICGSTFVVAEIDEL